MKKLIAVFAFMAAFAVSNAMAVPSPDGDSGGTYEPAKSESTTESNEVKTKYTASAAEAAATDGDTNTVSWTFE